MIAELQTALIDMLTDYNTGASEYVKQIKPYGGEIRNPKNVNFMPSLYVDVAVSGEIDADDGIGELITANLSPELILFDENKASGSGKYGTLAKGIDWVIAGLKGKIVTVNGVPVVLGKKITFKTVTDFPKPFAVIRPALTVMEN